MSIKNSKAVFEYYTFQLTPTKITQLNLFDLGINNVKELREKKNEILLNILSSKDFHFYYKGHQLNHRILWAKGDIILLRVANVKSIKAERAFKEVYIKNEPSILIAFNNNSKYQTLAIERDLDVFTKSDAVSGFIKKSLSEPLNTYSLEIELNNRFSADDFWDLIEKYQHQIRELKIEITRENLSDIYETISDELVEYGDHMNAQKQILIQEAPDGGVLENVNKENQQLNGFVVASSKGTGPITMKLLGWRRSISTKNKTISKEVDVTEIDNLDEESLLKVLDKIFNLND